MASFASAVRTACRRPARGGCQRLWLARLSTTSTTSTTSLTQKTQKPQKPQTNPTLTVDGQTYPTDEWCNVPVNVVAAASRRLHLQPDHPLSITRQIIERQFAAPEFRYVHAEHAHPVVSTFQNFDSLGFPADHPGRSRSDTYYINRDTLLRTHTSAHELESFRANASPGFLLSADVYRRDEIDRTHYPVFHQMEGARVWAREQTGQRGQRDQDLADAIYADLERLPRHDVVVEDEAPPFDAERNPRQDAHSEAEVRALGAHLKRSLELMVVDIFRRAKAARQRQEAEGRGEKRQEEQEKQEKQEELRMRWVEAYFPFTSPSWELEVYFEGQWLEVLGCGVSQQSILRSAGVPSQVGWAFGLGLDRIAMLLFQIPDIRLFWSQDRRFLDQFVGVSADLDRLRLFVPFSKYPACYKDVSFWLPGRGEDVHDNDVMEIIRSVAGDVAESVQCTDAFQHPRTGRQSRCYRINYRSLERTLTNAETNQLHGDVTEALVRQLAVEIR